MSFYMRCTRFQQGYGAACAAYLVAIRNGHDSENLKPAKMANSNRSLVGLAPAGSSFVWHYCARVEKTEGHVFSAKSRKFCAENAAFFGEVKAYFHQSNIGIYLYATVLAHEIGSISF